MPASLHNGACGGPPARCPPLPAPPPFPRRPSPAPASVPPRGRAQLAASSLDVAHPRRLYRHLLPMATLSLLTRPAQMRTRRAAPRSSSWSGAGPAWGPSPDRSASQAVGGRRVLEGEQGSTSGVPACVRLGKGRRWVQIVRPVPHPPCLPRPSPPAATRTHRTPVVVDDDRRRWKLSWSRGPSWCG